MPRRKHPLAKCLDVVDKLMKHPHAMQLFNAPVDIKGLGLTDYLEIVKTPMDLGTIRGRLQAGLSSDWVTCEYDSPEQVLEDIKLVWQNCIAYNTRPDEAPFAQMAREMVTKMNQLWSQAGLGGDAYAGAAQRVMNVTPEAEISHAFNSLDVAEVPVRVLDRLMVYGEDGGVVRMWSLDCQHSTLGVQSGTTSAPPSAIFARGTLKAPDEAAEVDAGLQDIEVDIGPIMDWSVSLSGGAAHVCIQTDAAWYRVLGPSTEYEPMFFLCQLFARLCQAALMALREVPTVELDAFLVLLCRHLMSTYAKESLLYHIQVCLPLLCKFLNAWAHSHSPAAVGLPGIAPVSEPPVVVSARRIITEIIAMHQIPMEVPKRMQHIAKAVSECTQLKHKAQGPFEPPLGGPNAHALAASPGLVSTVPDGQFDALAMTTPPQPLRIGPLATTPGTDGGASAALGGAASGARALSNAAAAAAGGESEKRRLHLESKRAYEAERRRRKAAEEEAQRAAAEKEASAARGPPPPLGGTWRTPPELLPSLLSVWDFLGTFSDILWLPPIPLERLDAALSPNTEKPEPCDEASEFVLRDVHCALLRTLEGRAGKGAEPPVLPVLRTKRTNILPCVGDHHWQVRLAKLLEGRAYDAAVYAEPRAAEALDKMRMGDYLQLTLAHRFAILNLLINIALSGEMLRGEIGARVEDFNAIKNQERGLPVGGRAATKRSSKKSAAATPAAASKPAAATANQHITDAPDTQPRSNTGSRPPANSKRRSSGGAERNQQQDAAAAEVDDSETEDDPDAWGDGAREGGREPSSGKAASGSTMDADSQEAPDDQSEEEDEEEDSDEDERDEDDEAAEADAQAGADGIAQWWIWAYSARTGLRRCLGTDTLGRRYWLMAGRAGAYQIIVESKPPEPHPETGTPAPAAVGALPDAVSAEQPWGVYTGSDIFKLVAWLRAGSMAAEEPVRRALEQAPVPLPAPETVIVPGKWQDLPIPEEASELNSNLPDGYKGILAPTMPGALIQPFTLPREAPPPASKVHRALHEAASSLRWWAHGHPDAEPAARRSLLALLDRMHGSTLQPDGAPGTVRTHGKGVMMGAGIDMEPLRRDAQELAAMLTDRHAMDTSWTQERHEQWLEALRTVETPCELTMLVSVFTLNVHWQRAPVVMHRGSFHNFAATQHVPLHFPVPGDRVAVLRTGLMVHIQHIRDAVLRPRRWGRDGGGTAAPARGTGTPGGSASVGAVSGEQMQMGGVSRRESMNELATSSEGAKSENKNASNSVVPNAASKQGAAREAENTEKGDKDRIDEDGDQVMQDHDTDALKPKPEPDTMDQKLKLNVAAAKQTERAGDGEGGAQDVRRGGSCALDSARGQHSGSGDGGSNAAGASLPPVPPPTRKQESWLQEINEVEETAKSLNPVQLMTVAAVSYIPADIPEAVQRDGWLCVTRPPTSWLMLRHDGGSADVAREPFVLPIHADAALPDYVVPLEAYERGRSQRWQAGDRFRMQFGGRKGSWYRGTVVSTRGLTGEPQADPWEALAVKWEDGGSSAMPRVSPWEVELDPNSKEHKVAEQRIKLQKECRAARTSKRTIEGAIEGEPPTQRARSLASSTSLTAETTPFGGAGAPFNVAGDAAPAGRRGSVAGDRTPRAAGTQHINAAALPVFHPPKMEKPSSEWYSHSIGQDVLNQLPEGDAFRNMIVNFHQGRGNSRFKVPNFGGVEVDLSVLFNEILVRGGVYTIAENRLWKEVVKALKLEGGGSVATTNVRQAYEKSLRCFELYMRSGAFARDLESDSLPPAGQAFSSRTQLIRIWDNSGKAVPEFVTFQPYKVDANGEPKSATAATAAAATTTAAAAATAAAPAANSAEDTARCIAAAAAAIGAGPAAAASAQPSKTSKSDAAADTEPQKAAAPKPELKMVPQGPEKNPPSHEAPKLVNKKIWRMWDGHGWFPGEVTHWDEKEKVHEVVFAKDTPQPVHERMNLLMPPVTISWRDPNRLVSATAAAIAQAALHQCTGSARSARTSGSGGAGIQTGAADGQQVQ